MTSVCDTGEPMWSVDADYDSEFPTIDVIISGALTKVGMFPARASVDPPGPMGDTFFCTSVWRLKLKVGLNIPFKIAGQSIGLGANLNRIIKCKGAVECAVH
jgi:hypothetical protein